VSAVNLNAYFERIGFAGSIAPTFVTLEQLAALHPAAIPFENLDSLLGRPVKLDTKVLARKLLTEQRGGYCFEHALLLREVLLDLDFAVTPVGGRVIASKEPAEPFSHMALLVDVAGSTYLVDVGFGRRTPTAPLRLRDGTEQDTPHGRYRLTEADGEWTLAIEEGAGTWTDLYAFTQREIGPEEIEAANIVMSTSPDSGFTRELRVSLSPEGQRLALRGAQFSRFTIGSEDESERRQIADIAELKSVLLEHFRIGIPGDESSEQRLAAIIAPTQG